MAVETFKTVWFLPEENTWREFQVLAYRDVGTLTLNEDSVEFRGNKGVVVLKNLLRVSYEKQGRDFINNWVRIEYGDAAAPFTAFFADGSLRGWGGIFGGTKKIFNALDASL